jgi:hypothetical protein
MASLVDCVCFCTYVPPPVLASYFIYLASGPNWPGGGEIDIVEGVHDNVHNQVAFHTENGECFISILASF